MGQTLTHGVYLPDEGERNCYDGLASNWSILDGAVGTVAEHTSQIAGKAPLVHTHTKSDVTDLFNSANTWTGNNTFLNFITSKESAAISAGAYGKGIVFRDYQNNRLGYIQPYLTSDNAKRLLIGADSGDIASNSNLLPNAKNSVNLGSSSYQWNNLYAKRVNTQSVNGINPGALSLPDMSSGTGVSLSAGSNSYSPPSSGWLSINLTGAISVVCGNFCHSGTDMLSVPVVKGSTYTVTVATSGTAYLFVSQGNV